MLLNEKINDLQKLTKKKITYEKVAKVLGLGSKQAAQNRVTRKQELKDWEILALDEAFLNGKQEILDDLNNILLDYYPEVEASCGTGIIPFGETKEQIAIPINLIRGYTKNKKYIVIKAVSDSMQPEIKPNDLLIVRVIDAEPIVDNHIYIFCHEERIYCKYLSYNVGQVIIRSANKDYPTRYIEGSDLETFRICGEVCGSMRNY